MSQFIKKESPSELILTYNTNTLKTELKSTIQIENKDKAEKLHKMMMTRCSTYEKNIKETKEALKTQGALVQSQRQKIKELKSKIKKNRALLKGNDTSSNRIRSELASDIEVLHLLYHPDNLYINTLKDELALVKQCRTTNLLNLYALSQFLKQESPSELTLIYNTSALKTDQKSTVKIKSMAKAKELYNMVRARYSTYEKKIKEIDEKINQYYEAWLSPTVSTEELVDHSIQRGIAVNSSTIEGFDFEAMLKEASALSGNTKDFKAATIAKENCSTTCMKILNAGAPENIEDLFFWSEVSEGKAPTNTFITNPQAVYTAAVLTEKIMKGDQQALDMATRIKDERSKGVKYKQLLNTIIIKAGQDDIDNMLTYYGYLKGKYLFGNKVDIESQKLEEIREHTGFWLKTVLTFIFSPFAIYHFIKDYFSTETIKGIENTPPLLVNMINEIKQLNNGHYLYVDLIGEPRVLISNLLTLLNASKENIPFFRAKDLDKIEQYILELEASTSKTDEEKDILLNYKLIINERNSRIDTLEQALAGGFDIKEALANREERLSLIQMKHSKSELVSLKINAFMSAYAKEKQNQFFSFLRPGFVKKLLKDNMAEDEKLEAIELYVSLNPTSLSAKVWANSVANDFLFISLEEIDFCSSTESTLEGLQHQTIDEPQIQQTPEDEVECEEVLQITQEQASTVGSDNLEDNSTATSPVAKLGL